MVSIATTATEFEAWCGKLAMDVAVDCYGAYKCKETFSAWRVWSAWSSACDQPSPHAVTARACALRELARHSPVQSDLNAAESALIVALRNIDKEKK